MLMVTSTLPMFTRIGKRMYLNHMYAPQGKAGMYSVLSSQTCLWLNGCPTVVGYIIRRKGGKLQRVTMF